MLHTYVILALRMLRKNPLQAAIAITGLAVGMAACLLILLYTQYERSYDRWLPGSGRIYQVEGTTRPPGQPATRSQNTPAPLRDLLPAAFPQIEALTQIAVGPTVTVRDGQATFIDALIADRDFFRVFALPFLHGTPATALPDTNAVVLTRGEAVRQFGTADVLGRTIALGAGPGRRDYRITGVLRDIPPNSNFRFGLIFRQDPAGGGGEPTSMAWRRSDRQHYAKLREGADAHAIDASLPAWQARVIPPDARRETGPLELRLRPIGTLHLAGAALGAMVPVGDPAALSALSLVALLTLAMAVLNFVNLATARATLRAREVALRKTLGASRTQLIVQFLTEALVVTGIAMLVALSIAELSAAPLGTSLGVSLHVDYMGHGALILPAAALFVATALVSGLYPAFHLSRFRPADVLHTNRSGAAVSGGWRIRTLLVTIQFAAAIALIAGTAVMRAQTDYVARVDPGYRRGGLIQIDSAWRFAGDVAEFAAARRELATIPGVVAIGRTNLGLMTTSRTSVALRRPGATRDISVGLYAIDGGFVDTMGGRLLAGRLLDDRHARDRIARDEADADAARRMATRGLNVLVNRSAAARLGFADPAAAIGQAIVLTLDGGDAVPATVVGVVEDMRVRTARDPQEPIVYAYDPTHTDQVIVRFAGAGAAPVMAAVRRIWRRYEPEIPFHARTADAITADAYAADRARGALFAALTALAVIVACLGLYSLAAFTVDRRRKEIGIRKVLGARGRDIAHLLVWQFCRPVALASLIAWPIAWWAMRGWLDGFALRVALGPAPFLIAGMLALGVALLTILGHAIRASRASPVDALRHE